MKEEIYNEKELKELEDGIRALGIPYSQNEPDERYFANFRVHLMERIEANEQKKNILASIWSWLGASTLRSVSLAGGLAAVIIAALLMNQTPEPKTAHVEPVMQAPALSAPQPIAPPQIRQNIAEAPKKNIAVPKTLKNSLVAAKITTDKKLDAAIDANNFAGIDQTLTGSESDGPINYENLSESDLESVVKIAEAMQ